MTTALCGCSPKDGDVETSPDRSQVADTNSAPSFEFRLAWPEVNRYLQRLTLNEHTRLQLPRRPQPLVEEISLTQRYALTVAREDASGGHEFEETLLDTRIDVDVDGRSIRKPGQGNPDHASPSAPTNPRETPGIRRWQPLKEVTVPPSNSRTTP